MTANALSMAQIIRKGSFFLAITRRLREKYDDITKSREII